jgi:cytochrome c553
MRKRTILILTAVVTVAIAAVSMTSCAGAKARPTDPDLVIDKTPERVERGQYLVDNVLMCGVCHTSRDTAAEFMWDPESTDGYLAGGARFVEEGMFSAVIPNITQDPKHGIGAWSDDEIFRAVFEGFGRDGQEMSMFMDPYDREALTDEDKKSVVAYLRTVPAVANPVKGEFEMSFLASVLFGLMMPEPPPVDASAHPAAADKMKRGEGIARAAACIGCHSQGDEEGNYLGGTAEGGHAYPIPGVGQIYARNISSHAEHGVGRYSHDELKNAMLTGTRLDGKRMAPPMSLWIPHISALDDEDMDALIAFIKAAPATPTIAAERVLTEEGRLAYDTVVPATVASAE